MLIPKQVFKVGKVAAKVGQENTRYAIHGVRLERDSEGRCSAVTTDGARLIRVSWNDAVARPDYPSVGIGSVEPVDGFETIVSMTQWCEAGKLIPRYRAQRPVLDHCLLDEPSADGTLTMGATDLENPRQTKSPPVDGHFPKYQDVIPDYAVGVNAVEIGVNPKLFAELVKIVGDVTTDDDKPVGVQLIVPTDPRRPLVVKGHTADGTEATGIMMPVNLAT